MSRRAKLRIGFIPLADAAALIVAVDQGSRSKPVLVRRISLH